MTIIKTHVTLIKTHVFHAGILSGAQSITTSATNSAATDTIINPTRKLNFLALTNKRVGYLVRLPAIKHHK